MIMMIRSTIPGNNFVGRYGGDEFIAIIYDLKEEGTCKAGQKLGKFLKRYAEFLKRFAKFLKRFAKFFEKLAEFLERYEEFLKRNGKYFLNGLGPFKVRSKII